MGTRIIMAALALGVPCGRTGEKHPSNLMRVIPP
jgi:hypothetical protein